MVWRPKRRRSSVKNDKKTELFDKKDICVGSFAICVGIAFLTLIILLPPRASNRPEQDPCNQGPVVPLVMPQNDTALNIQAFMKHRTMNGCAKTSSAMSLCKDKHNPTRADAISYNNASQPGNMHYEFYCGTPVVDECRAFMNNASMISIDSSNSTAIEFNITLNPAYLSPGYTTGFCHWLYYWVYEHAGNPGQNATDDLVYPWTHNENITITADPLNTNDTEIENVAYFVVLLQEKLLENAIKRRIQTASDK